jgi:hypothetical protein
MTKEYILDKIKHLVIQGVELRIGMNEMNRKENVIFDSRDASLVLHIPDNSSIESLHADIERCEALVPRLIEAGEYKLNTPVLCDYILAHLSEIKRIRDCSVLHNQ